MFTEKETGFLFFRCESVNKCQWEKCLLILSLKVRVGIELVFLLLMGFHFSHVHGRLAICDVLNVFANSISCIHTQASD